MTAINRAADIIKARQWQIIDTVDEGGQSYHRSIAAGDPVTTAQVLADAGLLLTDEIQAVLDTVADVIAKRGPTISLADNLRNVWAEYIESIGGAL